MSEAKFKEIATDFAGKSCTPSSLFRSQGDWVIVTVAENTDREDDFYQYALFHVPTWAAGTKPALHARFTDLSHVGVKGNGQTLVFGEAGEVLKTDGNDTKDVKERFQLSTLLAK